MNGEHWTRGALLRHPLFWLVAPLLLGPPAWGTALFFQQVHLAEVKGWALTEYVALYPWLTITSISATFLAGIALDRFGAGRVLPIAPIPYALGFILISNADTLLMAAIGLTVTGIGMGMQGTVLGAFWAEFYGTRHIGAIKAAAAAVMVLGSAIGPGVSGFLIDFGMPFTDQMMIYAVYFVTTASLAFVAITRARKLLPTAS